MEGRLEYSRSLDRFSRRLCIIRVPSKRGALRRPVDMRSSTSAGAKTHMMRLGVEIGICQDKRDQRPVSMCASQRNRDVDGGAVGRPVSHLQCWGENVKLMGPAMEANAAALWCFPAQKDRQMDPFVNSCIQRAPPLEYRKSTGYVLDSHRAVTED